MSARKKKSPNQKMKRAKVPRERGFMVGSAQDMTVIRNPPGMAKMSEVLADFLQLELRQWDDEQSFRSLLLLGMACWNAAMDPVEEQETFIQKINADQPPEIRSILDEEMRVLMRRKERHFADNRRKMLDVRVTWDEDEPYFEVLSSME